MVQNMCTICNRRFNKTEHFKRHERSHTNERPYECTLCHKRFSRSDVLSRHVKSHNKKIANLARKANKQSPSEHVHDALASATVNTLAIGTTSGDTQGLLPSMCTDALALQAVTTSSPGIPLPPSTDLPPSSSAFLADVPAHHACPVTNVNPMIMDDQQEYFGWNKAAIDQQSEEISNEVLQLWLQPRRDTYSMNGSDLIVSPDLGLTRGDYTMSPDQQHTHSAESIKSGDTTIERFAKVQRYWLLSSNRAGRIMISLWRDVVYNDLDNLFAAQGLHPSHSQADLRHGSHYGLDQECKLRLQAAFDQIQFVHAHQQPLENDSISQPISLPDFPPAEVLNMALDCYFQNFHPLIPFMHLPTFSARNTRLSLLYMMCLIGMAIMETKTMTDFISKNFQFILDKITADLAKCSIGSENPLSTISTFATAFLFLNLAAMTGEMVHFEKCQLLYVNLMSITQRHGLFAASEGQLLDTGLYEAFPDLSSRWKAWSKVESTKRLIIGLLHIDACYSSFMSTSPIIAPDSIQMILPCDEDLFRANSPMQWLQLIESGKPILMPTIISPSENVGVPTLSASVDDFGVQGVLAMVHIRLSEAYGRLLSGHASNQFAPCQTYAMDGRARSLPSLQMQIVSSCGESFRRLHHNTLIMWHSMCLRLTADTQILDLAAGRAGPVPAQQALDGIAAWSQTPAARRACLHAAHIYKSITILRTSDLPAFHSATSLFFAALVLALYSFVVQDFPEPQTGLEGIELLDEVDWNQVGTEGFTSFMEPHGSHSLTPTANAAMNYIRNGGSVYFRGLAVKEGPLAARRILLDYASHLKDLAPWTMRKFTYVLHIMGDVLMGTE